MGKKIEHLTLKHIRKTKITKYGAHTALVLTRYCACSRKSVTMALTQGCAVRIELTQGQSIRGSSNYGAHTALHMQGKCTDYGSHAALYVQGERSEYDSHTELFSRVETLQVCRREAEMIITSAELY